MSGPAREAVFKSIRASLGRDRLDERGRRAIDERLASPKANVIPARGQLEGEALIALFISEAERVNVTIARVTDFRRFLPPSPASCATAICRRG